MSYFPTISLGTNALANDAWGRPKVYNDYSLIHGLWTYGAPFRIWLELLNGVEQSVRTQALSENGMLKVFSNANTCLFRSKRHPRYQPNRGHLYSTACILQNATLGSGTLYAVVRKRVGGVTVEDKQAITLPAGIDLSKGNIFDIQMQWRGVGGIKFFINLQEVYHFNYLGTLTGVSVSNPAAPVSYQCSNDGKIRFGIFTDQNGVFFEYDFSVAQDTTIYSGCVDVTAEGGYKEQRIYGSVNTGINVNAVTASLNGNNGSAVLAIRIPKTISYNGDTVPYTRDYILTRARYFCKDEATMGVYFERNNASWDGLVWSTKVDNSLQYILGGVGSSLQTTFATRQASMELLATSRSELDFEGIIDNPDMNYGDFYLVAGDVLVMCIVPDGNGVSVGASLEYGEEI